MIARYVPLHLVEQYLAQGWRMARRPFERAHRLFSVLMVLE